MAKKASILANLFASLAARLEPLSTKDPQLLTAGLEAVKEKLEERPVLKTLYDMLYKHYLVLFNIIDNLEPLYKNPQIKLTAEQQKQLEYIIKIQKIRASLLPFLKKALKGQLIKTITSKQNLYNNAYTATVLAYQDIARYTILDDKHVKQTIKILKVTIQNEKKELQLLLNDLRKVKKELASRLKVNQENVILDEGLLDSIKTLLNKTIGSLLKYAYKLYRFVFTKIAMIQIKIDKFIEGNLNKVVKFIAGDDPMKSMGVSLLLTFGKSYVQGKLIAKALPMVAKTLGFAGAPGLLITVFSFLSYISRAESLAYGTLREAYAVIDSFEKSFSEIEQELDNILSIEE